MLAPRSQISNLHKYERESFNDEHTQLLHSAVTARAVHGIQREAGGLAGRTLGM